MRLASPDAHNKGLGRERQTIVKLTVKDVKGRVIADCGHFLPEEQPGAVVRHLHALWAIASR